MCPKFQLVKVFNFSDKLPGFSKTIGLCLKFCMGFWINRLIDKTQYHINHASHLKLSCSRDIERWAVNKVKFYLRIFHFIHLCSQRSSPPWVFRKEGVLKNFARLTGQHLCRGLFFINVSGFRPATLLKRDSDAGIFLWILWIFLRTLFYRSPPAAAVVLRNPDIQNLISIRRCNLARL